MDRSIVMKDRLRDLMASGESEFGRRVDMMEERMTRQIREENRQALERARAEVERCRMMMENEDGQRQEDLDKVGKGVRGGIAALEAKLEKEFKRVREEQVARVEEWVKLLADEQRRWKEEMLKGLLKLEKKVDEGIAELGQRLGALEGRQEIINRFLEDVKGNMQLMYEGVQTVQHVVKEGGGRVGVEELKEVMERERSKLLEEVRSVRKEEGMEVEDGGEAGGLWSEVVKKGVKRNTKGNMVVIEVPKGKGGKEAREELIRCLDPKAGEGRVKGIRRQGKDFVVEVHDTCDVEKLRGEERLSAAGFRVDGEPRLDDPRVIIYKDTNEVELVEMLWKRNRALFVGIGEDEVGKCCKPKFKTGPRNGEVVNWVVQVSPALLKSLKREGRVYLGLRSCRVVEYVGLVNCN